MMLAAEESSIRAITKPNCEEWCDGLHPCHAIGNLWQCTYLEVVAGPIEVGMRAVAMQLEVVAEPIGVSMRAA